MFYLINKTHKYNSKFNNYIGIFTLNQFQKLYKKLNIDKNILDYLTANTISNKNIFEEHNNYNFGIISFKDTRKINLEILRLGIYISKKDLFVIIIKGDYNKVLNKLNTLHQIKEYTNNAIENLITHGFNNLEYIENQIINIENELFKKVPSKNLNITIFSIKKQITLYRRYYESLLYFFNNIKKTNNKFINKQYKNYILNLESKINRLNNNYYYLYENIIHLREIYQSSLDYYQNKIIKLLTIITTIFLPLSLITSWYGMNFKNMPEINYIYSYPIIILISILVISICIIFMKKKKII